MAIISATSEVPATSVDLERISIVSASPSNADTDEAGRGSMYDMTDLAAGRLFHVHRADDAFLLSYATSWKAATPASNAPGTFSAKTAYALPTFWWINPSAGGSMVGATSGYDTPIGQLYPQGDAATLHISSATSIKNMVIYLGSHRGGTFLAFYRVNKGDTQLISTQWNTPVINADAVQVTWDRGVYGFPGQLMVVGASPDKSLYLMRTTMGTAANQKSAVGGVGQTYLNNRGWQLLPGDAEPLHDTLGNTIKSEGNVSLINYRNQWLMSVVVDGGTTWNAKFYRALHPSHDWIEIDTPPVVLGPKTVSAMLCGAYFQDSVTPNAAHAALAGNTSRGAVAYTYTVESATALRTNWGLLPVPVGQI